MEKNAEKLKITVALAPGTYLVDVHRVHPPRIWRFTGEAFEGHEGSVKRAPAVYTIHELISREESEGPIVHIDDDVVFEHGEDPE